MKKITKVLLASLALCLAFSCVSCGNAPTETVGDCVAPKPKPLVIDAGHGGEDGGASSPDGVLEKDLNLAVSEDVAHLCVLFGQPYVTTRREDKMLYDLYPDGKDYTGRKKSLDLRNRLKLAETSDAAALLSIHMNKFTSPVFDGLQVYYSPNAPESAAIADEIQSSVKNTVQTHNSRVPKAATSSIFLLDKAKMPAVLVECGFLSNPDETCLLTTDSYRASLSCAIFAPVLEFCTRNR